ncbi:hypothetical protein C8R46DRAFT_1228169 [Mycena filopes]|nr:hypothetical protein C8R46DRAFT_1228169 [Mycena filopes]
MTPAPPSQDPTTGLRNEFTVDSAKLRAEVSARTPIRFSATNEPPTRVADLPHEIGMMNDIRVVRRLGEIPFPVPLLCAQRWLVHQRAKSTAVFAAYAAGNFRPAACAPFEVLRDRVSPGREEYVGEVRLVRTKVWNIGAVLRPEFHRQGIATAAVGVVINDWAIPQMGCTELQALCFVLNVGSVKIWERYGFIEDPLLRGEVTLPESKGGGVEATCVLVWHCK